MRDALLLSSIRESINSIEEYLRDGRLFFFSDKKTRDAVLRNLHTLSESAQRISVETRRKYPDVAWRDIAGFRNVVVHDYLSLDLSVIWDVVSADLPALKSQGAASGARRGSARS